MKIRIPIPVKVIVTSGMKGKLLNDIEQSIGKIKIELEQLQFQQKKLLFDAQKKGSEAIRIVHERIDQENKKRTEKLDILISQLEHIEKLQEGDIILQETVESEVDINIGDKWDLIFKSKEIIIKDGIVIDIRGEKG